MPNATRFSVGMCVSLGELAAKAVVVVRLLRARVDDSRRNAPAFAVASTHSNKTRAASRNSRGPRPMCQKLNPRVGHIVRMF